MADLTVTPVNVKITSNTATKRVQFGEAVDQGEYVYLKTSDQKYWLAVNSAEATADGAGVALTPNIADGYGLIATAGDVDMGATVTVAEVYTVSSTAGKVHPKSDLATGEWFHEVGIGKTAALLTLTRKSPGIQEP
jgi:hypothetical protein